MKGYSLPLELDEEIDQLEELIRKFNKGEASAVELKAHRVPFGIYEQRELGTYMMRVRCAAGTIQPSQLEEVARIASRHTTNDLHITSRQELQIHYIKLDDIIPLIRALKEIGLATRGGGGNTVRNIVTAPDAGTDPEEVFDVSPYAVTLTTRLIAEQDSWNLPRKFKIAFSGSAKDKGYATLTDVGFIARIKDGQKGFRVYAAGGLGAKSELGKLLLDFVETDQVYPVAKALKNIFWKYGNRKNKHAARMRFLWNSLGGEEFKKRFHEEYARIREEGAPPLVIESQESRVTVTDLKPEEPSDPKAFGLWSKRFVTSQKQQGLFLVGIPVELGFIPWKRAMELGHFLRPFGDDVLRMTNDQNFLLRNIPAAYLGNVFNFLSEEFSGTGRSPLYGRILSCAGASTCQLGVCLSRQAAKAMMKLLDQNGLDLDRLGAAKINISGCPNSCGQHPAADLGFFGKVLRKDGHVYPAYTVLAGAVIRDGGTQFAEAVGDVAAKHLPGLVKDLCGAYLAGAAGAKSFPEYLRQEGKQELRRLCERYREAPPFEEDKNFYFDWDATSVFSLAGRGAGECSAGLFDLIEADQKNIKRTREKLAVEALNIEQKGALLAELIFYVSRMLLITRGIEPKNEEESFNGFSKYFIEAGLIAPSFKPLLDLVQRKDYPALSEKKSEAVALADSVEKLYENMDNAFNFKTRPLPCAMPKKESIPVPDAEKSAAAPAAVKDLRGVACPMNFVKTKVELSKLKPGDILEVWLDDGPPIENVPGSVKAEGHQILLQKKVDDHWSVVIKK